MSAIPGCESTYEVTNEGQGDKVVAKGSTATVHATGIVEGQGKFWSTKDAGQKPFTYQAGVGGVIKGWDQGCLGMKGKFVFSRRLCITSDPN